MPKIRKKKVIKPVEPLFHIFCEGKNTEPDYINGFKEHYYSEKRRVIIVEDAKKNTPIQLVEEALKAKKSALDHDVFWVVFDRESVIKYTHKDHIRAAELATSNNINIAISTVCFEYWILLHFKYTTTAYEKCDDVWKSAIFKKLLSEYGIKDYKKEKKSSKELFTLLQPLLYNAIENAERANVHALKSADPGKENPTYLSAYSNVHELLIDIKNFIDMSQNEYIEHNSKPLDTESRKKSIQEMINFFKPQELNTLTLEAMEDADNNIGKTVSYEEFIKESEEHAKSLLR